MTYFPESRSFVLPMSCLLLLLLPTKTTKFSSRWMLSRHTQDKTRRNGFLRLDTRSPQTHVINSPVSQSFNVSGLSSIDPSIRQDDMRGILTTPRGTLWRLPANISHKLDTGQRGGGGGRIISSTALDGWWVVIYQFNYQVDEIWNIRDQTRELKL